MQSLITIAEIRKFIQKFLNESKDDGTYGHDKPPYRGTFFGQVVAGEQRLPTGKRRPIIDPDTGEEVWIRIKAKQTVCYWTWNGTDWVTAEEFEKQFPRKQKFVKPKGLKLR